MTTSINIERGHQCNDNRLTGFIEVAKAWQRIIKRHCEAEDHAPYYYNERANISILAAGACELGMFVLEEYPTRKQGEYRRGALRGSHRCDLMIWDDRLEFQIEAKQCWLAARMNDERHKSRVTKFPEEARKQADRNTASTSRLGCAFFTVWWPRQSEYQNDPSAHIRCELKRILSYKADLWAWSFPDESRKLDSEESDGTRRFYPGIIMGLKSGKYARFQ